jgi:membrane fusion protein, macrolide-specific efflux system
VSTPPRRELGSLNQIVTALGKVEPLEYVDVGAQISGQIDIIHVPIGGRVEAGELLLEIHPTVYQMQVAAARCAASRRSSWNRSPC